MKLTRTSNSTVEGGGIQAQSYCAPQNAACGSSGGGVASEQDFQSQAHQALRNRVGSTANPVGVYTFHFQTKWHDDKDVAATEVMFYEQNAELMNVYQRGSLEPTHLVSEQFYENGTSTRVTRRLMGDEVCCSLPNRFTVLIQGHSNLSCGAARCSSTLLPIPLFVNRLTRFQSPHLSRLWISQEHLSSNKHMCRLFPTSISRSVIRKVERISGLATRIAQIGC